MSALSLLKVVKNSLTVIAILVAALILLTSVQPTDAEQEEAPRWRMHVRKGCVYVENGGIWIPHENCYRAYCDDDGTECTWEWGGACFKPEGGYCDA